MKTYRRILVPIFSASQTALLLHRVSDLVQGGSAQLLVVRILDTHSGYESDGPAGMLPEEAAGRRARDAGKRLDLQLARHNLAWAEARVLWRDPKAAMAEVVDTWNPDLVVTIAGGFPEGFADGADILRVDRRNLLGRLADAMLHFPFRHA